MVFVRMLAVAWLSSLYAALLLVLLVFFLNPIVPIRLGTLAALLPLWVLLSLPLAVAWPAGYRFLRIFARRRLRLRWFSFKYLLGFSGVNLVLVSILYGLNAELAGVSIPQDAGTRLRVAACVVGLTAVGVILAALIQGVRKARATRRACFLAAGLLPILLLMVRGSHTEAKPSPYTPELVPPSRDAPRLLVFGFEGATLDQVLPLVAQGKLPWLGKLIQQGAHGRLASFRPCVPVVAWESLFTGKLPSKHHILGDVRYDLPFGGGELRVAPRGFLFRRLAPLSGMTRSTQNPSQSRALTLVQILNRLHSPAAIFRTGELREPRSASRPSALLDRFLDPEIPTPPSTRRLRDDLRRALEEDEAVASEALEAWRGGSYGTVVVQLPGLDRVSHLFLRYAMPASFGDVPPKELEKYGAVLERYYRYLDDWIGEFLAPYFASDEGIGERKVLVMIVSPYGIEPVPLLERFLLWLGGDRLASGYHDRAPDGLIVAAGSGVFHGKPLGKASILDVTPTLLYDLRLAIGMDMDGHPLTHLFDEATISRRPVLLIPSYEASRISRRKEESSGSP